MSTSMNRLAACLALSLAALLPVDAHAARVDDVLAQRLTGDWTGTCAVAAVIDEERVETGRYCADLGRAAGLDGAFEVGSVSKTMNAALLAALVADEKLDLDAPLSRYVPEGIRVPDREGKAITLRQLATHTSGLPALPPGFAPGNPADPYADLTPAALFAALGSTELASAPGSAWAYSNFGAMLLSAVVANAAGGDYDAALRQRLFAPLGMAQAGASTLPPGVRDVIGHRPGGSAVPGWRFAPALGGVGGVRATLDDMVRYAQAQLGQGDAAAVSMVQATHAEQSAVGRSMGLGWMRAPLNGRTLLAHEGGTGGFSSFIAIDPERDRAVVVLADTALANLGGLSDVGLPLLDAAVPVGKPRMVVDTPAETLAALAGEYRLANGMVMTLAVRDGALTVQVPGQPAFALRQDSRGDFFPAEFDALLKPAAGNRGFAWVQGGGAVPATRVEAEASGELPDAARAPAPSAEALRAYAGEYPLQPGFALRVFVDGSTLMAQATGQGAFALDPAGNDRFEAAAFGIVIDFERGDDGLVRALTLAQGGGAMRGVRK
jgi:CubicO group peptidase (beta-lactamase class C family)